MRWRVLPTVHRLLNRPSRHIPIALALESVHPTGLLVGAIFIAEYLQPDGAHPQGLSVCRTQLGRVLDGRMVNEANDVPTDTDGHPRGPEGQRTGGVTGVRGGWLGLRR